MGAISQQEWPMSNKYYSNNHEKQTPGPTPPKQPGITVPTVSFPQYPDKEQKGLGKV